MTDRIVPRDDYVMVVEATTDTDVLYQTISNIASSLTSPSSLMQEFEMALPNLTGLDFVIVSYYSNFISPSLFEGYSVLALQPVPDELTEAKVLLNHQMLEMEISRVLLVVVRPTTTEEKFLKLKEESEHILEARIKLLQRL